MTSEKIYVLDYDLEELKAKMIELGEPEYRATQLFQWVYRRRVYDLDKMSNLSKALRSRMAESFTILAGEVPVQRESKDGTRKLLLDFGDKIQAETVLIPLKDHSTACLSTQSGCPVKCAFCATGQGKFVGNLSAGQIVEQFLRLQIMADKTKERISHIVYMGMGEPLLNYDNTLKSIRILHSDNGLNIGARKITISTVGIPDKIRRLARENMQFSLALSLHTVDQKLREDLIPLAKKYPLREVLDAVAFFSDKTTRGEITLEYVLLKDLNCSGTDAEKLAEITRKLRANVNLIVYNPTAGSKFAPPAKQNIDHFVDRLRALKVNVHMRASRGQDIDAACGQLRNKSNFESQVVDVET
jgi:23S rRNA (adenine2503-C2)-methyltransferase